MESKKINVSILQMSSVIGDVNSNINKVDKILKENLKFQTDVIVLPEVWTVGWACRYFQGSAKYQDDILRFLSETAKKYGTSIIGGSFIEKNEEGYFNTCPVFDRRGNLIAKYSKNHLFSYYGCDEGNFVNAGDAPVMVELDGVNFGLTICYDIRFPEIYRAYAKSGADVLVNCAAWGSKKSVEWEVMTKSRAVENQCYMIALTQSGEIENGEYNLGESRIIGYKGSEISSIMENKEGFVSGDLDISEMYEFREKCKVLSDIKDNYEVKVLCKN